MASFVARASRLRIDAHPMHAGRVRYKASGQFVAQPSRLHARGTRALQVLPVTSRGNLCGAGVSPAHPWPKADGRLKPPKPCFW